MENIPEFVQAIIETVRALEDMERRHDPAYGWAEAGLLLALRKAWATYDYEKLGIKASADKL
jgi:hypothetical protein